MRGRDQEISFARHGPALAALLAVTASLPGLGFPFLSDDWLLVDVAGRALPDLAPYDYFRPLYTATFWLDLRLWGPSPLFFHLTNLILIAASAALVVAVARRYTGDARLAALTGLLFALHPYHVENAAWVAVRGDPLYSILLLLAAWSYDRWRVGGRTVRGTSGVAATAVQRGASGASADAPHLEIDTDPGHAAAGTSGAPKRDGVVATHTTSGASGGVARGAPVAALLLFEAALLSKETAIVLLPLLVVIGLLDRSRRAGGREWKRGLLPLALVGLAHFMILRPLVLSGRAGRTLTPGMGAGWARHAFGFGVAAIVPVDGEILAAHPLLCGSAAAAALLLLIVLARRSLIPFAQISEDRRPRESGGDATAATRGTDASDASRGGREPSEGGVRGAAMDGGIRQAIPGSHVAAFERQTKISALLRTAVGSAVIFGVLLLPSIVGFQERYLYLPAAASCLLLASLILCLRARASVLVLAILLAGWGFGCAHHWLNWRQAAIASRRLVADLVAASRRPDVEEIVVANMPFRVRGGSVAGDFEAALRVSQVSGAKPVRIRAVSYVSYPWADAPATDSMEAPGAQATARETERPRVSAAITSAAAEVVLRIPEGPFSHYVGPKPLPGERRVETSYGTIYFDSERSGIIRIRIPVIPDERRGVYAWLAGRLERLSLSP